MMRRLVLIAGCAVGVMAARSMEEVVDGVAWTYEVDQGEACLIGGDSAYAGDLVVPERLGGIPVTELDATAFALNAGVTSVVLPAGITNLPFHAFCNARALTNLVLRAPYVHLGESSLSGTGLVSFSVPEGEVDLEADVFQNDASLESVTLPSTLRTMGRSTFYGCASLKEIRFPVGFRAFGEYDWEQHWPFYDCRGLEDVFFFGRVPANLEWSGLLALDCRIHYPRAYAGEWADWVPGERFGGFTGEGAADKDGVFWQVVDGTAWYYTVSEGEATLVDGVPAYMGDLVVPERLGGLPVTGLDASAFVLNTGVTSVVLPAGVTNLPFHAFCNATALTNLVFRAPYVHLGESCLSGAGLRTFCVPEGESGLETDVFQNDASLESVTLPSTLRTMGRSTFYGCAALKEVRFPAGFEAFGEYEWEEHWPFYGCGGLEDAYFLGGVPVNLEWSGLLALDCRIHYPRACAEEWSRVVPAGKFGGYTDAGDPGGDVDPPDGDGVRTETVGGVAWRYEVIAGEARILAGAPAYSGDLYVPDDLGGVPVTSVATNAFSFNARITGVSLPAGVTNLPFQAFCGDGALTNVTVRAAFVQCGESCLSGTALRTFEVPEGTVRLEADVFHGAEHLESVTLPYTLRTMGRSSFRDCASLTEVRFPAGFESFERRITPNQMPFNGCTGLEDVYFFGPPPENLEYSGLLELGCRIHYPAACSSAWRAVVPSERFGGYVDDVDAPRPACRAGVRGYSGVYDGAGHGIAVSDVAPSGAAVTFALAEDGDYGPEPPAFTNVCACMVWCRVEAPGCRPATRSATVEIRPGALRPGDGAEGPGVFAVEPYEGVYDGRPHSLSVDVSGLADADVAYACSESDLRAGRCAFEPPAFTDAVEATVWYQVAASNFTPYVGSAAVRVLPRPVTLSSRGGWKAWDGEPLVRDHVDVGGLGFVEGEGVEVHVTGSQTEIGSSDNAFWWTPSPGTLTSNYEVVVQYGLLRVTKGPEGTVIIFRGSPR